MKKLHSIIYIALFLAISLSLASCLTVDVDPDPAALDETTYEESAMGFSEADDATFEATSTKEQTEVEGFDPSCGDNCSTTRCLTCTDSCMEQYDGQKEQDCINSCFLCGRPCFC